MPPQKLSEQTLCDYKDFLYDQALNGEREFYGLLEAIKSRENIIESIRVIQEQGDFWKSDDDCLEKKNLIQIEPNIFCDKIRVCINCYSKENIVRQFDQSFQELTPNRVFKIIDNIIQISIYAVIEPILEAQFYAHSYGFRPMRSMEHVLAYISSQVNIGQRYWCLLVDMGDKASEVSHDILINKLYKYGIRDKRLLTLIRKILRTGFDSGAGLSLEKPLGRLLYNLYFTDFDRWVADQWTDYKTHHNYATHQGKIRAQKNTGLKSGYLIRYGDKWLILTDSEDSAQKWKHSTRKFLKSKLKLDFPENYFRVYDLTETWISFAGIEIKASWNGNKFTLRSKLEKNLLKQQMKEVYSRLKDIRHSSNSLELFNRISLYNQLVRKINNYYQYTTLYSVVLSHESWKMRKAFAKTAKVLNTHWFRLKDCVNLFGKCKKSDGKTLGFRIEGMILGLEPLGYGKFRKPSIKGQWITPYTSEGRKQFNLITHEKWSTRALNTWMTASEMSSLMIKGLKEDTLYNLEYYINRSVAFIRDGGRCQGCGKDLSGKADTQIHHKNCNLPLEKVNKISNLITLCPDCHVKIHNKQEQSKAKNKKKPKQNSVRSSRPSKEELEEMMRTMYFADIGDHFGVSRAAVAKWAKGYGIYDLRRSKPHVNPPKSRVGKKGHFQPTKRPEKEVLENLMSRMKLSEIAAVYEVSRKAVVNWTKFYDIYDQRLEAQKF